MEEEEEEKEEEKEEEEEEEWNELEADQPETVSITMVHRGHSKIMQQM